MSSASPLLPDATRALATFAATLDVDDIPAPVVDHIKLSRLKRLAADLDHLADAAEIIRIMAAPIKN